MERVGGIEPPSSGWKPEIITTIRYPLYLDYKLILRVCKDHID